MYISNVVIRNFRNFKETSFDLSPRAVIVGENAVGKSNFLHALRLVLDPTLSDSERRLGEDDFNSSIKYRDQRIEVEVRLAGFEFDSKEYSLLCDYLEQLDPVPIALFNYVYRRKESIKPDKALDASTFQWSIVGPQKPDPNGKMVEKPVRLSVRQMIEQTYLGALRDVAGDISVWRRSPLRPLINQLNIDKGLLDQTVKDIKSATRPIVDHQSVKDLNQDISDTLLDMVGAEYGLITQIDIGATNADKLLRLLTLIMEGGLDVDQISTGLASVLYITLWLARIERQKKQLDENRTANESVARILTLEEPESHLHPHLQRLVFRRMFSAQQDSSDGEFQVPVPVIVSTHSPYILSVAPIESVVRLHRVDGNVVASSASLLLNQLSQQDRDALQRYMDVTRNELLFAKRVILVEGTSDQFIVSRFAELFYQTGEIFDSKVLDKRGITVCAVQSANFEPFVRLLSKQGLSIPFVVITDGDPTVSDEGKVTYAGVSRAIRLARYIDDGVYNRCAGMDVAADPTGVRRELEKVGIFVGEQTLEFDLWSAGAKDQIVNALSEMDMSDLLVYRLQADMQDSKLTQAQRTAKLIDRIKYVGGKGWLAQIMSPYLESEQMPAYIRDALQYLAANWRKPDEPEF
jgi:putative ATP-dependent endonuclease of the OLD family